MKKIRKTGCIVLSGLLLTGCTANTVRKEVQTDVPKVMNMQETEMQKINTSDENTQKKELKMEGWRIQDGCPDISEDMAETVYQELSELNQELYAENYEIKNSRVVFLKEEVQKDTVSVRAVFERDQTSIRKPEEHPLIQGMYAAKEELDTDQKKQAADEYIDGLLKEFVPVYQKTERFSTDIVIKFERQNPQGYELYYPFIENSRETLKPLRKYAMTYWKEDKEKMYQMGRARLLENALQM